MVNASTKHDGFVITGCTLGFNTGSCGKIKGGNGLILDNRSQDHGWCVWSFATEMCWLEGYGARRVLVQGGTHTNWYGVYSGFGLLPGGSDAARRTPLNVLIDIVGNRFLGIRDGEYGILMDGVAGGRVRDNQVVGGKRIHVTCESRGVVVAGNSHA